MSKYGVNIRTVASVRIDQSDVGEMVNQLLFGDIVEIINQEPESRWLYIRKLSDNTVGYVIFKTILPINNINFSNYKTPIEATCSPTSIIYPTKSIENFPLHNSPLILSIGTSLHNYNKTTSTFFVGEQEYYINPQDVNINNTSLTINKICESVLNTPYLWAGRSIMGFDCSGFVQCIYQVLGLTIRRSSRTIEDKNIFDNIGSIDNAQIGDIILFVNKRKDKPSHCGIYLGNNQVIHCSGFVHISYIDNIGIRDEYMEQKDPFCFIHKILRPKQKDNLLFNI